MKSSITISIDSEILEKLRNKRCPFSLLANKAYEQWLSENLTLSEATAEKNKAIETADEIEIRQLAEKLDYYAIHSKFTIESYKLHGFSDEKIKSILDLASKNPKNQKRRQTTHNLA